MARDQALRRLDAVWRMESARLVGGLVRLTGDLSVAEDAAQEALVAALERWPATGVPDNPGAWLMTTARHRALDQVRRRHMMERKEPAVSLGAGAWRPEPPPPAEQVADQVAADDVLRLMLVAAHPLLSPDARVALTLRLVCGLTTAEIARAFLVPEATVAQRLVRAKRTLSEARVPFELPAGADLSARIPSLLHAIYLVFNEGYAASHGEERIRHELCQEAMRLGRILVGLVPHEAEAHGLLSLMELHGSRARARVDARGMPVLLMEQDRGQWDRLLIHRGLASLARAEALSRPLGSYTLQAAIAACHARATTAAQTDWPRIVALYDALVELTGSPVVELNRAVAVSMAHGAAEGLALLNELAEEPSLTRYHLLPAARAELLLRLGRRAEAHGEFLRAAGLAPSAVEQRMLRARARDCQ